MDFHGGCPFQQPDSWSEVGLQWLLELCLERLELQSQLYLLLCWTQASNLDEPDLLLEGLLMQHALQRAWNLHAEEKRRLVSQS